MNNFSLPSKNLSLSPATPCVCERAKGLFFFDVVDQKFIKGSCKAYICPVCGPKKAYKFQLALTKYLNNFDYVRLFTFTQHTPDTLGLGKQNSKLSKAWSLFVKRIRADKSLNHKQRRFDYVRVVERTKRGYLHYHVVISTFMPILKLREHWNNALFHTFGTIGGRGGINILTIQNKSRVAKYLTKYLSKGVGENFDNIRRWSKSNKIAIFEHTHNAKQFILATVSPSSVLNLKKNSISIQFFKRNLTFNPTDPPPESKLISEILHFLGIEEQKQQHSIV